MQHYLQHVTSTLYMRNVIQHFNPVSCTYNHSNTIYIAKLL